MGVVVWPKARFTKILSVCCHNTVSIHLELSHSKHAYATQHLGAYITQYNVGMHYTALTISKV